MACGIAGADPRKGAAILLEHYFGSNGWSRDNAHNNHGNRRQPPLSGDCMRSAKQPKPRSIGNAETALPPSRHLQSNSCSTLMICHKFPDAFPD